MINYILIGILAVIVGGAVFFLLRAKQKGQTCIGCPHAGQCQHRACQHTKSD